MTRSKPLSAGNKRFLRRLLTKTNKKIRNNEVVLRKKLVETRALKEQKKKIKKIL